MIVIISRHEQLKAECLDATNVWFNIGKQQTYLQNCTQKKYNNTSLKITNVGTVIKRCN